MSPIAQFFSVATITFGVLGFPVVALSLLGATFLLTLLPFITATVQQVGTAPLQTPVEPPARTPNETAEYGAEESQLVDG